MSHFWRQSVKLLYSHRVFLFKQSTKFHFKSFRRPNSIRMSSKQTTILSFFKRSDANDRQISHQLSDSPAKETRKRKSSADGHKLEAKKEDLPEKESNQETKSQLESNSDSDSNSPIVKRRFRRIMVSESEDESNSCSADAKETQLKEEPKESKAEMKVNEIKSKLEDDVNEAEESVNRGKQRKQKKSSPKTNGKAKSSTKSGKEETESRQDSKVESKEEPQTKVNGKKGEKPIIEESKIMDAVDYQPSKSDYDPVEDAPWKKNEKVPYLALAKTFEEIENVSSRLKMIEILGNYLWSVKVLSPDDLLPSVYLCLNKLGPDYEGVELGIGDSLVVKALAEATGRKPEQIKAEVEKKGDLGLVAESSRGNQRVMFQPPKLTVKAVFDKLKEIALMSGHSVMSKKVEKIKILLVACRHCEARYLVRSLTGKLRIGLAEQSLLVALARCVLLSDDQRRKKNSDAFKTELDRIAQLIKNAYCQCPNYEKVLEVILNHDVDELPQRCQITPGIPLKPMLAHPTKDISEILRRFENSEFTCEYKYDGERAQVHVVDKEHISVYSRSQENYTAKYPDIASRMSESMKEETKSCILDCEAVAWDTEAKQILPFQVLSTRKRKDVKEEDIKVKVCLFAFDLLYLNGESLISKPLRQRRELLRSHFEPIDGRFMFATSKDFSSIDDVPEFLEESIKGKCEGLMVKCLDHEATYEIAKRSHSWLKLKKDYIEGVGDTIDVVVIGAYYGKGKRTGNYGGYLLAVYDDENEEFQSVCKLGTGFKDEDLEKHTAYFKDHIIPGPKSYYSVDDSLKPDVWFDVSQVWEIKAADLSVSPVYRAAYGMIESEKGISLRFPRFLRIRDDKKPEDSTTAAQIAEMYESQEQVKKSSDGKNINDD